MQEILHEMEMLPCEYEKKIQRICYSVNMRTIKILPADSIEEEKESTQQVQQVLSWKWQLFLMYHACPRKQSFLYSYYKSNIFGKDIVFLQDGLSEAGLTKLVLKFIETIGVNPLFDSICPFSELFFCKNLNI